MSQNDLLSSHITESSILPVSSSILCPTHYIVQHMIVCNKILCPHLPKGSFLHLSHVNILRSYHAALAKKPKFQFIMSIITYHICELCLLLPVISISDVTSGIYNKNRHGQPRYM